MTTSSPAVSEFSTHFQLEQRKAQLTSTISMETRQVDPDSSFLSGFDLLQENDRSLSELWSTSPNGRGLFVTEVNLAYLHNGQPCTAGKMGYSHLNATV